MREPLKLRTVMVAAALLLAFFCGAAQEQPPPPPQPVEPVQPAPPVQPVQPAPPVQPVQSAPPVQPIQPVQKPEQVQPVQPAGEPRLPSAGFGPGPAVGPADRRPDEGPVPRDAVPEKEAAEKERQHERERVKHFNDNDQKNSSFIQDWAQYMKNFLPQLSVTFQLHRSTIETFYQEVTDRVVLRGAFVVNEGEEQDLVFRIYDPNGEIVFSRKNSKEAVFVIETKEPGVYSFSFQNNKRFETKNVVFAMGFMEEDRAQKDDVNSLLEQATSLHSNILSIQTEMRMLWVRQRDHYLRMKSGTSRLFWISVAQVVSCLVIMLGQIGYIKRIVLRRHVVF